MSDGTVWMKTGKFKWVQMDPGEYCIDGFQYGEGTYFKKGVPGSFLFECKSFESDEAMEVNWANNITYG